MKAFVVGGAGGMGQAAVRDLIKQERVEKVVIGTRNPDPARLHAKLQASDKVSLVGVDALDHAGLVKAVKGCDVVINCAGPFYKTAVAVAKASIEAGLSYLDICDDYEAAGILFASADLDAAAKKAGVMVLTGMGSDPGTNNIVAKYFSDQLDQVDEIDLYWIVSIADIDPGAAWDHSLHMVTGNVPQFLDGKLQQVPGGTGEERVKFLDPLGENVISYVGHPQPLTLPRYIPGVKKVVIKGALIPTWVDQFIKHQNDTGFLGTELVDVGGVAVRPYDLTLKLWDNIPAGREQGPKASGMKMIVKGVRAGKEVTYTADMVGSTAAGTGLPVSIAALMLDAGEITAKGVVAPEGCIDPKKYLAQMIGRGAKIHVTETSKSILTL